jgi:peroxiredoxin
VSIDTPETQRRLATDLSLPFALLSDPSMKMIRAYGMRGEGMDKADMGYVVIDKHGRIRTRQVDRRFGEHVGMIVREVEKAKT